jgi:arabinogalactan endo-1,4-beta-galactosidase
MTMETDHLRVTTEIEVGVETSMTIIFLIEEVEITTTDRKENRLGESETTATTIEETGQLQGVKNLIEKLHQVPKRGAGIMIGENVQKACLVDSSMLIKISKTKKVVRATTDTTKFAIPGSVITATEVTFVYTDTANRNQMVRNGIMGISRCPRNSGD